MRYLRVGTARRGQPQPGMGDRAYGERKGNPLEACLCGIEGCCTAEGTTETCSCATPHCWGADSCCRATFCGTCCIPCVYARAYELQHPHFEGAECCRWCNADEMPQTIMGRYACCCMSVTEAGDAMVPFFAAYEATHTGSKKQTKNTCSYLVVGALPCLYCQPCQIAAELHPRPAVPPLPI